MSARLLYNEDGSTLDEIVFDGCVHLEQMNDGAFYLGVGDSQFWLQATKGKLTVTGYTVEDRDFPRQERHKTAAEVKSTGFRPAYVTLKGDPEAHQAADDAALAAALDR